MGFSIHGIFIERLGVPLTGIVILRFHSSMCGVIGFQTHLVSISGTGTGREAVGEAVSLCVL